MKTANSHSFLLAWHEQELEDFVVSVELVLWCDNKRYIIPISLVWGITQSGLYLIESLRYKQISLVYWKAEVKRKHFHQYCYLLQQSKYFSCIIITCSLNFSRQCLSPVVHLHLFLIPCVNVSETHFSGWCRCLTYHHKLDTS